MRYPFEFNLRFIIWVPRCKHEIEVTHDQCGVDGVPVGWILAENAELYCYRAAISGKCKHLISGWSGRGLLIRTHRSWTFNLRTDFPLPLQSLSPSLSAGIITISDNISSGTMEKDPETDPKRSLAFIRIYCCFNISRFSKSSITNLRGINSSKILNTPVVRQPTEHFTSSALKKKTISNIANFRFR